MTATYRLHNDSEEFFHREDRNTMRMTGEAAMEVCKLGVCRGFIVARIEGGRWQNPGFESRLDSIWNAGWTTSKNLSETQVHAFNLAAHTFIEEQIISRPWGGLLPPDVFILSVRKISATDT